MRTTRNLLPNPALLWLRLSYPFIRATVTGSETTHCWRKIREEEIPLRPLNEARTVKEPTDMWWFLPSGAVLADSILPRFPALGYHTRPSAPCRADPAARVSSRVYWGRCRGNYGLNVPCPVWQEKWVFDLVLCSKNFFRNLLENLIKLG